MFRLTVQLANLEGKKDFNTTHTYNNVMTERDAINLIWNMHSSIEDTGFTMSRKIKKATYNGAPLNAFNQGKEFTKNGWVLKENS